MPALERVRFVSAPLPAARPNPVCRFSLGVAPTARVGGDPAIAGREASIPCGGPPANAFGGGILVLVLSRIAGRLHQALGAESASTPTPQFRAGLARAPAARPNQSRRFTASRPRRGGHATAGPRATIRAAVPPGPMGFTRPRPVFQSGRARRRSALDQPAIECRPRPPAFCGRAGARPQPSELWRQARGLRTRPEAEAGPRTCLYNGRKNEALEVLFSKPSRQVVPESGHAMDRRTAASCLRPPEAACQFRRP